MTLLEALETVRGEGRGPRSAAARALLEALALLARQAHVSAVDADDVIAQVALKIVQRSPLDAILRRDPAIAADREGLAALCAAYVRKMLANLAVSWARDRVRKGGAGVDPIDLPDLGRGALGEVRDLFALSYEVLDGLVRALVDERPAQRVALEQAWAEARALSRGEVTMAAVLAAHGCPPAPLRTVRNRLYQRHHRLRQAILDAAEAQAGISGDRPPRLTRAQLLLVQFAVDELLRGQNP